MAIIPENIADAVLNPERRSGVRMTCLACGGPVAVQGGRLRHLMWVPRMLGHIGRHRPLTSEGHA